MIVDRFLNLIPQSRRHRLVCSDGLLQRPEVSSPDASGDRKSRFDLRRWLALLLIFYASVVETFGQEQSFVPDSRTYEKEVAPFLKAYCGKCHGEQTQEAQFRVDQNLNADLSDRSNRQRWSEVIDVLNGHSMPPETEAQPSQDATAKIVDWVTEQSVLAETVSRSTSVVLRRLNRHEYRNTIRDLVGVDFDTSGFPQDPPAGGFDNNGSALTMSPLHLELYYNAAGQILDRAILASDQPPSIQWRFEPESGDSDSNRVVYDGQRVIVNGGNNVAQDGFRILHHESWDRNVNARDFRLAHAGDYIIRVRAAGTVPTRNEVVESARGFLQTRLEKQSVENPKGEKYHREQFERDILHFQTNRMYDFGPPRARLTMTQGGQPRVLADFDVNATPTNPEILEFRTRCTAENSGVTIDYAYSIPSELENFWFQTGEAFARPRLYIDWIEIEGPIHPSWPPASHTAILFDSAEKQSDESSYARQVLMRFMSRAFRRPVTNAEVDEKHRIFGTARNSNATFEEAIRSSLTAVLVSPNFLYLTEDPPDISAASSPLSDHQLAARLSYFLWSTMPDTELTLLADGNRLSRTEVIHQQVDRMLAHANSAAFVRSFAGQWLGLRDVGANPPAEDLYPQYDRHLETSMVEESEAFFAEILRNDLDAMNFVKSDFVVINERLARFYGIDGVKGDNFRRVALPESVVRGGVMTQASMLTITSNGTRTSPVKRGTWILKNILGTDPGLPVANAGEIAPKVPGIDKATVRQRLEIHRSLPQCARCHNKIDPLGFALENFNACGEFREREGHGYKGRIERDDPLIDASSQLPDGTKITGVGSLQNTLIAREDLFLKCISSKVLTYALGREPGLADQKTVSAAVLHMKQNGRTLRSLIQFVCTSPQFNHR